MSNQELLSYRDALNLVPMMWIPEFTRFVEEGEASDEFMDFFRDDANCQRAFETILKSDRFVAELVRLAGRPVEQVEQTVG